MRGVDRRRRFRAEGEHSFRPPVTVDGDYIYFVDEEGYSYSIVRIKHTSDDPVLERYGRAGARPAAFAPSFGVTSGRLYFKGLDRTVTRDDDPPFDPVEGAVKEL